MRDMNDHTTNNSRAKLKQRVAGGAVLLIILAIFLPFIFSHSHLGTTTQGDANTENSVVQTNTSSAQPLDQSAAQQNATASADLNTNNAVDEIQQTAQATAADPAADQANQSTLTANESEVPGTPSQPVQDGQMAQQAPTPDQAQAAAPQAMQQAQLPAPAANQPAAAPAQPEASVQAQAQTQAAQSADETTPPPVLANQAKTAKPVKNNSAATASAGNWVVQVGSFTEAAYAKQLVSKLRHQGMNASLHAGPNNTYRVYVGPVSSHQQAQLLQDQIKTKFQISGIIKDKRA